MLAAARRQNPSAFFGPFTGAKEYHMRASRSDGCYNWVRALGPADACKVEGKYGE
jgi:hypothetical protein